MRCTDLPARAMPILVRIRPRRGRIALNSSRSNQHGSDWRGAQSHLGSSTNALLRLGVSGAVARRALSRIPL